MKDGRQVRVPRDVMTKLEVERWDKDPPPPQLSSSALVIARSETVESSVRGPLAVCRQHPLA